MASLSVSTGSPIHGRRHRNTAAILPYRHSLPPDPPSTANLFGFPCGRVFAAASTPRAS